MNNRLPPFRLARVRAGSAGAVRRLPPALAAAGLGAVAVALLLAVGLLLGQPSAWDRTLILALRVPDHPGMPIGPAWIRPVMVDLTALGGGTVLTLAVAVAAGWLLIRRLWLTALLTVAATLSGSWVVSAVKVHVGRARPRLVEHLVDIGSMSFPSGHAANSALVYLTLAGLATQVVPDRRPRNYLFACAVLLVGAIGVSRVYLGVHWPSDVLAGWSFGTLWALGWWVLGAKARTAIGGERDGAG